ncbi:MAG TPA: MoaD/ThiS family protein [Anaerolineae bacterium]|nr:MoaD/ThiS family protein [Anaerolineae bacterium]HPL30301.1 MoaD/ThiS family protein [Anaerolineae bacterium]
MVEVHIFGALWPAVAPDQEVDLGGREVSVRDLIARLGVDPEQTGIVTIDGRQCRLDDVVPPACRLCVFPPLSGG